MVNAESTRRFKIASALLGIVASALIGGIVKGYLDRAKPSVELAYVDFTGTALPKAKIRTSPVLIQSYENLPYRFPSFMESMTFEDFDGIIELSTDHVANLNEALPTLLKVREILTSRATDYPKDRLRLELLGHWTTPPGDALDATMRMALAKHQYYSRFLRDDTFQKYRVHPEEWKDPGVARIAILGSRSYDLGEDIIGDSDDRATRADKVERNLQRRLWIYLDRDLLIDILNHQEQELRELTQATTKFVNTMREHRLTFDPERVHATAVITNFGQRPAIFRSIGAIALKTGRDVISVEAHARVGESLSALSAFVVKGGETMTVDFFSKDSLPEISKQRFASSNSTGSGAPVSNGNELKALYDTEVMDCNIVLYQIKGDKNSSILRGARKVVFGRSVNKEASDQLSSAISKLSW